MFIQVVVVMRVVVKNVVILIVVNVGTHVASGEETTPEHARDRQDHPSACHHSRVISTHVLFLCTMKRTM